MAMVGVTFDEEEENIVVVAGPNDSVESVFDFLLDPPQLLPVLN